MLTGNYVPACPPGLACLSVCLPAGNFDTSCTQQLARGIAPCTDIDPKHYDELQQLWAGDALEVQRQGGEAMARLYGFFIMPLLEVRGDAELQRSQHTTASAVPARPPARLSAAPQATRLVMARCHFPIRPPTQVCLSHCCACRRLQRRTGLTLVLCTMTE